MNYNIDVVLETLNITLKQALQYHPQQVQWLRIEGDLEFRKNLILVFVLNNFNEFQFRIFHFQ